MKKIILTAFCSIMLGAIIAYGQNGWLPPVNFPSGTQLCDDSPWQLVFYDGFDGNQLSDQWLTYITYRDMPGGDNENWDGARWRPGKNWLYKKSNVIVQNGICRLLFKNEHYSWHCDTCPVTHIKNQTGAIIETPFYLNGQPNYYNSGKFEARIKMPVFEGSLSAFWLWHGLSVNEIDIAEAFGALDKWPLTTYNLHAWGPGTNDPNLNPYNLPGDANINSQNYPNQNWWSVYLDYNLNGGWHTYTCYWDTAKISFYIDDAFVNTIWKYYQWRSYAFGGRREGWAQNYMYKVYPTCSPISGTWNITYGYPYNSHSDSHIRFTVGINDSYFGDPSAGIYTLGEMDVDYVKVWQRHPEGDHEPLCNIGVEPVISGPTSLCGTDIYSVTPIIPNGHWDVYNGTITNNWISGNTAYAEVAHYPTSQANAIGSIHYVYSGGNEGCPVESQTHLFNCFDIPGDQFQPAPTFEVTTMEAGFQQFQLFIPKNELAPDLHPTFEWDIDYTTSLGTDTQHVHTFGRFTSTPFFAANENYYLHWHVVATGPEGNTIIRSGTRDQNTSYGRQKDTTLYYLDAIITDSAAYEQSVYNHVAQTFMSPDADTTEIRTMIEKVRAQELVPYIILPDTSEDIPKNYHLPDAPVSPNTTESATWVYPNPADNMLYIRPGTAFHSNAAITIKIYALPGSLQKTLKKTHFAGKTLNVLLSGLSGGIYIVQLQQGAYKEHYKIIKNTQ